MVIIELQRGLFGMVDLKASADSEEELRNALIDFVVVEMANRRSEKAHPSEDRLRDNVS